MVEALTKLGEAARRAREYISPWAYLSPSDVASNLPGGGIPAAVEPYKQGLRKTAEATQAFREGRWGDAARWYGSGMLDTATAGLSALPEGGAMAKLAMAAAPAIKAAVGASDEVADGAGAMRKMAGIRAFHGSPHDFDRFDMSKIGTGEGAQAYGHGLYFAEREGVARSYRDALSNADAPMTVWKRPNGLEIDPSDVPGSVSLLRNDDLDVPYQTLMERAQKELDRAASVKNSQLREVQTRKASEALEWLKANEGASLASHPERGRMYEVRINADPEHFLDWDKPLSEQSEAVRQALSQKGLSTQSAWQAADNEPNVFYRQGPRGVEGTIRQAVRRTEPEWKASFDTLDGSGSQWFPTREEAQRWIDTQAPIEGGRGAEIYQSLRKSMEDPAITRQLNEAGIPGIKYLDAGSRGAGDGTRNYVVFDDKLVEIIRKYGWMPGMAIPAAMALEMQQAQEQSAPQM